MESRDVIVVGAGIAGLCLARLLDSVGIDFVVFEKRSAVGTPGYRVINVDTFSKLGLKDLPILRRIKDVPFYSPSGHKIVKKGDSVRGYVINQRDLELELFRQVKNNVFFDHNVVDLDLKNNIVKTTKGDFRFKLIIFATGILGIKFRTLLNVKEPRNIFCYGAEVAGDGIGGTILDNERAPGFYGWIIPLNNNRVEVGFGSSSSDIKRAQYLDKVLFSMPAIREFKNKRRFGMAAGFIPVDVIDKKAGRNWIVIGDAAGGEPLMGGSIHKCFDEAKIAFEVTQKWFGSRTDVKREYEKLWDKTLKQDLANQKKIRTVLDKTPNAKIDELFLKLGKNHLEGNGLVNQLFMGIVRKLED